MPHLFYSILPEITRYLKKNRVKESLIGALIGLGLALLIAFLSFIRWGPTDAVSTFTTDLLFSSDSHPEEIVIVALDDKTVDQSGNWPLPRDYLAEGISYISQGNPKAIGVDLVFAEGSGDDPEDARLISVVEAAGNLVLGQAAYFEGGDPGAEPRADQFTRPFPELCNAAGKSAHLNVYEVGSRIPEIPPVIKTDAGTSFMFSLQVAAMAEGKGLEQFEYKPGDSLKTDDWEIPLGREGGVVVNYRTGHNGFPTYSLADILNEDADISPQAFSNKVVLIGPYWQGAKDAFLTPLGEMYGIEIHGNAVESILNRDFIAYLPSGLMFTLLILTGLILGLALANLSIRNGFFLLIGFIALIVISWAGLSESNFLKPVTVDSSRLFFDLPYPVLAVSLSFIGVSGRRYYIERARRKRIAGTFERFVTPGVMREILKSDDTELQNPQGRFQEITVLFMDIRGYTTITEKLPPLEVFDLLNKLFAMVTDIFTRHEGTINKFIGDAVMVIFNAPLPQPDHPLKAVRAACEIQEALESFDPGVDADISCGIGINTGMAMVGTVGSGKRMEYTCIGDTVNVASRLEGQAKEGIKIVIGPGTYEYAKNEVETRLLPETILKGKAEIIQLYEVISPYKAG
ncbi:MAG: adenylate/guanylate cyclase domain-containing protein [Dehalococcoidia bacterium]